jgi:hypothetical protein
LRGVGLKVHASCAGYLFYKKRRVFLKDFFTYHDFFNMSLTMMVLKPYNVRNKNPAYINEVANGKL